MNFEAIIDAVIEKERGFVNHPDDKGGPTNYGITQARARAEGWMGDMQDFPESLARAIYMKRYIVEPWFDRVAQVDEKIGMKLIDCGVNMGPAVAALFFQRALNIFNAQGSRYADIFPDGRIGPVTVDAMKTYLRWRGELGRTVMLRALNSLQGTRYIEIGEKNPSQESFEFGWFATRID